MIVIFTLLKDKSQLYATSKLDFKEEAISRLAFHSQYLFSDLAFSARNYVTVFCERFLIKLGIPEMEPVKKAAVKQFDF